MTSLLDTFPTGPLVLDASAIINLLGSGKPSEVVAALRVKCLIEEKTLKEIRRHPVPGLCHEEVLSVMLDSGHLMVNRMSAEAYELYLSLVSGTPAECLGDGESAAIATAVTLGHAVILDDGKARRVHDARFPTSPFSSSLRLFLAAGLRAGWNNEDVLRLILSARTNSRMNIVKADRTLAASLGI